jgi:hypothetical protein
VKVMRDFEDSGPRSWARCSPARRPVLDVNLQLFTDDPKALTMFLLNRRYRFEESSQRMHLGDRFTEVPAGASARARDVPVTLTVLDRDDERTAPSARGHEPQRARSRTSRRCCARWPERQR